MASSHSRIDPLKCQKCFKPYKDPLLLPCLHSFCKQCLTAEMSRTRSPSKELKCPTCKNSCTVPDGGGISAFPQNFALARQVKISALKQKLRNGQVPCEQCGDGDPAIVYCSQCACFLCVSCRRSHQAWKQLKSHDLFEVGSEKKSNMDKLGGLSQATAYCLQHPEEKLKFYCQQCEVLCCHDCSVVGHKNHAMKLYEEVQRVSGDELKEGLRKCEAIVMKLDKAIADRKEVMCKVESRRQVVDKEINKAFDTLAKTVDERRKLSLNQCSKIELGKLNGLKCQIAEFDKMKEAYKYAKTAVESHQAFELLSSKRFIKDRLSSCLKASKEELQEIKEDDVIYSLFKTESLQKEIRSFGLILSVDSTKSHFETGLAVPQATVDIEKVFSVVVKDGKGNLASSRADISVSVTNVSTGVSIPVTIKPGPSRFSISCTPPTEGEYQLSVSVGQRMLDYSPFTFWTNPKRCHQTLQKSFILPVIPTGLVVDLEGNLYCSCSDGFIYVFSKESYVSNATTGTQSYNVSSNYPRIVPETESKVLYKIGTRGQQPGELQDPRELSIFNDILYVADSGNNRIQKFTLRGQFIKSFCDLLQGKKLNRPVAITHDGIGHTIVGDSTGIHIFHDDVHVRSIQDQQYNGCSSLAMNNDGNIVVKFNQQQNVTSFISWSGQNLDPKDNKDPYQTRPSWTNGHSSVAVDGNCNCYVGVYVNDFQTYRQQYQVVIKGTNHVHWNNWERLNACTCSTHNGLIAIDKHGFLYLTNSDNGKHYVRLF